MSIALLSVLALAQAAGPLSPPDCTYDRETMLALSQQEFDQDIEGGWRSLAKRGCSEEAAELIRDWRHEKRAHASILYWHEGQLRAEIGQTEQAIALFKLTYKSPEWDRDFGWNHYVDGSIAFLSRDRERLARAIERLKEVPAPDNLTFNRPDGSSFTMAWPPNLNVLEAFDRCWDRPYAEAYAMRECVAPEQAG